jgi:gas vesicle protein
MAQRPETIRHEIEVTRERIGETVDAIGYRANVPARAKAKVANAKDAVVDKLASAKDAVVGSMTSTKDSVVDSMSSTNETMSDTMISAKDKIGSAIPDGETVAESGQRIAHVAERNPMGLAIGALAAGFVAGTLLPPTRKEQETFGPVAQQMREKVDIVKESVKETAQEAIERGKQIASDTTQTARQSLMEVGEEAMEAGKQAAQEIGESAQSSMSELTESDGETTERISTSMSQATPPMPRASQLGGSMTSGRLPTTRRSISLDEDQPTTPRNRGSSKPRARSASPTRTRRP